MRSYMEYIGQNTNTMQTYTLVSTLCGDASNAGLALTEDSGILTARKHSVINVIYVLQGKAI